MGTVYSASRSSLRGSPDPASKSPNFFQENGGGEGAGTRLALSEPLTHRSLFVPRRAGRTVPGAQLSVWPAWLCRQHVSLAERAMQTGHHPQAGDRRSAGYLGSGPHGRLYSRWLPAGNTGPLSMPRPWRLAGCLFAQTWAWPLPCGLNPSVQLQLTARSLGSSEAPSPSSLRPWNCMCGGIFLTLLPHSIFWERLIS